MDVYINVKEKSWRKIKIGATTDGSEETAVGFLLCCEGFWLTTTLRKHRVL